MSDGSFDFTLVVVIVDGACNQALHMKQVSDSILSNIEVFDISTKNH